MNADTRTPEHTTWRIKASAGFARRLVLTVYPATGTLTVAVWPALARLGQCMLAHVSAPVRSAEVLGFEGYRIDRPKDVHQLVMGGMAAFDLSPRDAEQVREFLSQHRPEQASIGRTPDCVGGEET